MRISDWSSDVCSSDLRGSSSVLAGIEQRPYPRTTEQGALSSCEHRVLELVVPVPPTKEMPCPSIRSAGRPTSSWTCHPLTKTTRSWGALGVAASCWRPCARPSWPSRSEEHTSELQSLMRISYAVFGLKTKKKTERLK